MFRQQSRVSQGAGGASGAAKYTQLENRLALLAWLNDLLGYPRNRDLLADCKGAAEGFGPDGRSFLYHHLVARGSQVKISNDDLARYDENIRLHLEKINRGRTERITLRYFQYLAALYTEIYLDRLFNDKAQLLADLNDFVKKRNASKSADEPNDEPFTEDDLTKLAFWKATGSGKTLILHLNYHQFLHYNREPIDNILLITPNEGLSEQHLDELAASGIPARRFDLNTSSLWTGGRDIVQVIEITKLVEEKRGGGVSVPVEAFEGRNLIFVDEGHKGAGGEAWRKYREALGATGFTLEYSATFGQALSAARNDPLTAEYGKSILFDYSYKYFYSDGFGKDFRILNLRDETRSDQTEMLLMGNLLSFYEQVRLYEEQTDALRPYNLEKPLWVFVGSTVNAVYTENKQPRSDVLTVVRFLHHALSDRDWAIKTIKAVLGGKTGLVSPDGQDVFARRFDYLRETGATPEQVYADILRRIFHAPAGGGLHLCDIKSSPGELGLKAANAEDYFGLIYIGDTSAFKKLAEEEAGDIALEGDAIAHSLFERINRPDSGLHVLIGAKKFMEGWNSWRVASMGLLNIGRQEGSQIIQLFGRGVRLKGKDMSLKRSAALEGSHPQHLRLLETLNIFAVRANYMAQFRDYLEREGVEVEPPIELPLHVRVNEDFLQKGLVVPRPPQGRDFTAETALLLEPDARIRVHVDLSVKVQAIESTRLGLHTADVRGGRAQAIPAESLDWVDWQQAYLDVLAYKARKGWSNLVIQPETLRQIVELKDKGVPVCTVIADERVIRPQSFRDRALLQQVVTQLLCRYVDRLYQTRREQWDEQTMVYRPLDENDPNLGFRPPGVNEKRAGYVIRVPRSEQQLVEAVRTLLEEQERLYQQENAGLPRIHFDRHLYQPLLVDMPGKAQIAPPGLKESEARFVCDLRDYWDAEKNNSLEGKEVFLLRNLSRGYGIGFFEERGFYPDFILWVVDQATKAQRIVFIEPHGMVHAKAYIHDEKARLHERLPVLADEIGKRSGRTDITLDAFIVSATSYDDLHQHYDDGTWDRARFAEKHILFQERGQNYDYLRILFGQLTSAST